MALPINEYCDSDCPGKHICGGDCAPTRSLQQRMVFLLGSVLAVTRRLESRLDRIEQRLLKP